jgi:AraC-like DNA-binding protein
MLHTFCEAAGSQSNVSAFRVRIDGEYCWFENQGNVLIKNDIQMENYRITCMIELLQVGAGKRWCPQQVSLMMADNKVIRANTLLRGSKLNFAQDNTAVRFPAGMLEIMVQDRKSCPICARIEAQVSPDAEADVKDISGFVDGLKAVISQYVAEPELSIEMIAEVNGCSVRSLQRRLKESGIRYNDLVNEARMQYSEKRLAAGDMPITDIAYQLGYNDAAHFSRAFKRWTGMTPRQFRKQH